MAGASILRDLLQARYPRDAALLAEVSGRVRVDTDFRGRPLVILEEEDDAGPTGREVAHRVLSYRLHHVHTGDCVRAGDCLTYGTPPPQEILRIGGVQAAQDYLLREMHLIFQTLRIDLDDRHLELIIAQMLRWVKVTAAGDTDLLPGALVERTRLRESNDRLRHRVKITEPGDSGCAAGTLLDRVAYQEMCRTLAADGKQAPAAVTPTAAIGMVQLLGLTMLAAQPRGFLRDANWGSAAQVLTAAALAGQTDDLGSLEANIIMGRLIPAGTGYCGAEERPAADGHAGNP